MKPFPYTPLSIWASPKLNREHGIPRAQYRARRKENELAREECQAKMAELDAKMKSTFSIFVEQEERPPAALIQ